MGKLRKGKLRTGAAAAVGALALTGAGSAIAAPAPDQQVDLKVLLVSADGSEPGLFAWQQELQREGIPFDTLVASTADPITPEQLAEGTTHARYQGVVFASDLVPGALAPEELSALRGFEAAFGLREVGAFSYPSVDEGMNTPTASGPMSSLGATGTLTTAGKAAFPYLKGPVTYDGFVWGYLATPATGAAFTTFVQGPNGSSLLGVVKRADGVEQMVSTVAVGPWMTHGDLLLRGMANWLTGGSHLGLWRNYLALHVDDIFSASDRWDVNANTTPEDGVTCSSDGTGGLPPCSTTPVRMKPKDVTRAAKWSRTKVPLDMVYNGAGSDDAIAEKGSDPLTRELLRQKAAFRWINHTYTHPNLDGSPLTEIVEEISKNVEFARRVGLPINETELVTGEHSGLANPDMPAALTQTGIRVFGSDNSRQPNPYTLGTGTALPRYPSNIYYNVGTRAQQLDEYNYVYFDGCVNTAYTTCLTRPATWSEYVNAEKAIMLRHVLNNDPRPHYVHQANLAEDGTLYAVADPVIAQYRAWFNAALQTPTMTQASDLLARQAAWTSVVAAGQVQAHRLGGYAYISSTAPVSVSVPLSGLTAGESYGGGLSSWVTVPAGGTVAVPLAS
ncbi:MAG: hypothetical protein AB1416_10400 [Actinomycetota bacterium]